MTTPRALEALFNSPPQLTERKRPAFPDRPPRVRDRPSPLVAPRPDATFGPIPAPMLGARPAPSPAFIPVKAGIP